MVQVVDEGKTKEGQVSNLDTVSGNHLSSENVDRCQCLMSALSTNLCSRTRWKLRLVCRQRLGDEAKAYVGVRGC